MGGKLYNSQRLDTDSYLKISGEVISKLKGRTADIPPAFKSKASWGDLDVILTYPFLEKEWLMREFKIGAEHISQNSSVISILYKNFQIDFIHMEPENFQSALDYYGRGDVGNLVGRLFAQIGFKYGHIGLYCPVMLKAEDCLGEIIISKDTQKILEFIDLNYNEWKDGFEDKIQLYNWVSRSKFFNKSIFKLENQNHLNRKRNAVRPVYQDFLKWLDNKEFQDYIPLENKAQYVWRAMLYFGNEWIDQAKPLLNKRRMEEKRREIFSGKDVAEITSFSGRRLGEIIEKYKGSLGTDWDQFVCSHTKAEMKENFTGWLKNYENKD